MLSSCFLLWGQPAGLSRGGGREGTPLTHRGPASECRRPGDDGLLSPTFRRARPPRARSLLPVPMCSEHARARTARCPRDTKGKK